MSSRKRCRNFTSFEIDLLLDLMTDPVVDVIENKMIDSATLVCKNETWARLTKRFHEAGGGLDRDMKSLKSCWKRLKEYAKKEKIQEERQLNESGGDSGFTMTGKSRKVCSILPKERFQGYLDWENTTYYSNLPSVHNEELPTPPLLHKPLSDRIAVKPLSLPLSYDGSIVVKTSDSTQTSPNADSSVLDTPQNESPCMDASEIEAATSTAQFSPIPIRPVVHPFSIDSERRKKRKLSPYREELLNMAREEHEAKMINLRLKRQYIEAQIKLLDKKS